MIDSIVIAPRLCDFCENPVKRAGFERPVQGNGDGMSRRSLMPQTDMASLLADCQVTKAFECADQMLRRHRAVGSQIWADWTGLVHGEPVLFACESPEHERVFKSNWASK